jgi:hypothetical protein
VLVFWFWQEIVFGVTYVIRSCAVVSCAACREEERVPGEY